MLKCTISGSIKRLLSFSCYSYLWIEAEVDEGINTHASLHIWKAFHTLLKKLSSEIDQAKSGLIGKLIIKGRGAEIFS